MNQGIEKGLVAVIVAQVVFITCAYILHAGLGRFWGPEKYGFFVVVISILVWIELATTSGIPTAVGKFIAEKEERIKRLLSDGIRIQVIISIIIITGVFFSAPLISSLLRDEKLTFYLRLASIDVPFVGFVALYWNALGGLRFFTRKALAIITYSILKTSLIFMLVFYGLSLTGAFIGNIIASIATFLAILKFFPSLKKEPVPKDESQTIIKFATPLTLYYFFFNLLIILDMLLVKSLLKEPVYAGYYASAHSIAKAPYFIFVAFSMTLLPLLSNSISKGDKELSLSYINKSIRFLLMLLVPGVLLVSQTSKELISLIYSTTYLQAAPVLSILIFGFGFLSLFLTLNTILIANNESNKVLLITLTLIPVDFFMNLQLIPLYGIEGAAISTTVTIIIGSFITSFYVYKSFKTLVNIKSCFRILLSAIIVFFISTAMPLTGAFIVIKYLVLFMLYFLLLYVTKEIEEDEVQKVRSYVGRLVMTR